MKSKKETIKIVDLLKKEYPDAKTSLDYSNAFELLIATILSAQCTDKRVNMVTPKLFEKFPDAKKMSKANLDELEDLVKSTGFYKNKALSLKKSSQRIVDEFNGRVPDNMDDLLSLQGVARKTANVVLGNAFNKKIGIVVDTHVKRLSNRIGFSANSNPDKIEKDLIELVEKKDWTVFSHLMIYHGRAVCDAKKPRCDECLLNKDCDNAFKFPRFIT